MKHTYWPSATLNCCIIAWISINNNNFVIALQSNNVTRIVEFFTRYFSQLHNKRFNFTLLQWFDTFIFIVITASPPMILNLLEKFRTDLEILANLTSLFTSLHNNFRLTRLLLFFTLRSARALSTCSRFNDRFKTELKFVCRRHAKNHFSFHFSSHSFLFFALPLLLLCPGCFGCSLGCLFLFLALSYNSFLYCTISFSEWHRRYFSVVVFLSNFYGLISSHREQSKSTAGHPLVRYVKVGVKNLI